MNNISFCRPTVLYVDDEKLALKYFARSFAYEYDILTAQDADSAIEILKGDNKKRIAILITDYRMPGRDGGNLLRQIQHEFPHLVRILLTAYGDREVLLDTVNSGEIFRILDKPLDMAKVREVLRLACNLAQERNMRQRKLMAVDETLSFLAHELNTPLFSISSFVQGLQSRIAGSCLPARHQAEIIKVAQAVDDSARYCLSLLTSFVESVKSSGAQVTPHLGGTAQQMILSLLNTYPLLPEQRAAIHLEVHEDFPITAMPDCIALVLSSVLNNALRAVSKQPEPMIRFTVRVSDTPQVCIADNGPGIPPEILQRLLVEPVTTHAGSGGKGRGMIFCKRIMQSFGGGISVSAAPGEHTTVTLNFPNEG